MDNYVEIGICSNPIPHPNNKKAAAHPDRRFDIQTPLPCFCKVAEQKREVDLFNHQFDGFVDAGARDAQQVQTW